MVRAIKSQCRKCGEIYWYHKAQLEENKVGIDICRACGVIRSLTVMELSMLLEAKRMSDWSVKMTPR
jgi:hypothetical protein